MNPYYVDFSIIDRNKQHLTFIKCYQSLDSRFDCLIMCLTLLNYS